jgi:hypothetical protein
VLCVSKGLLGAKNGKRWFLRKLIVKQAKKACNILNKRQVMQVDNEA